MKRQAVVPVIAAGLLFGGLADSPDRHVDSDSAETGVRTEVTLEEVTVVPPRATASEGQRVDSAETVAGGSLPIRTESGSEKVGDATVVRADVMASNGVIRAIDAVLLPEKGD